MPADTPIAEHLVYLDTETGGLRPTDRAWEIGLLVEIDGEVTDQVVLHVSDFAPATADPTALRIGGFYERHPLWATDRDAAMMGVSGPDLDKVVDHRVLPEAAAMSVIERLTRDRIVVGCNPGFDTYRIIENAMTRYGLAPTWHYRPLCATTYAAARVDADRARRGDAPLSLPYNNAEIGLALNVDRDMDGNAHTALADAHYARLLMHAARGVWVAQ